jgi:hypothetical protein
MPIYHVKEKPMKKSFSFLSLIALIALILAAAGCRMEDDPEPEPRDIPEQGLMSKETAQKVFDYGPDDGSPAGGVVITRFKDAGVLKDYLEGKTQREAAEETRGTFIIKELDGKPVTRIAPKAFAPSEAEGIPDITAVVRVVKLPETIEELGEKLFEGVAAGELSVDIPAAVVEKIVERHIGKIRDAEGEAAALAAREAIEETTREALETGVLAGSPVEARRVEPVAPGEEPKEPETITTGPVPRPTEPEPAPPSNPSRPYYPPYTPPVAPPPAQPTPLELKVAELQNSGNYNGKGNAWFTSVAQHILNGIAEATAVVMVDHSLNQTQAEAFIAAKTANNGVADDIILIMVKENVSAPVATKMKDENVSKEVATIMVEYGALTKLQAMEVVQIMAINKAGAARTADEAVAVETALIDIRAELDVGGVNPSYAGRARTAAPVITTTWTQRRGSLANQVAWVDQHLAIVANAQAIGTNLATVFLGDGLILEAVGGKDDAAIKADMPNIPSTTTTHVAAIEGATVEEIKYGIAKGWLPEKTAYTIVHAGRAEVEVNQVALAAGQETVLSQNIGENIGSIYPALIAKTAALSGGNSTSVIFSGIIPSTTIEAANVNIINGNDGIKKDTNLAAALTANTGHVKMIGPPAVVGFIAQVNARLNNQPTYVTKAMLKDNNGIFLVDNKNMDYKYYMGRANHYAKVAYNNQHIG